MNGRYKAYGEYKESGVAWLGEVPEGWNIFSIRRSLTGCTNGIWGSEPNGKGDIIVLRVADFERNSFLISDEKLTKRQISQRERFGRLLKCGDLLLEKSGGGDKTLVGCVVLFDKKYSAVTSNFVAKMSPLKGYSSNFLTFCFSQLYAGKVNYPSIKQTTGIQNLDSDAYLMEKFSFPSYEEQTQIATFLDHETAKIDTLIDKQQQLIELLKEKRQAVISHAVTKGLDPDVPMKDSGVEWLGEVPEHWIIQKIKWFATMKSGDFITSESIEIEDEFPVYGGNGLRGYSKRYTHDGKYVLIGRQGALCGNINYANGKFWASEHAVVVSPYGNNEVIWLGELFGFMNFNQYSFSAAQPGLAVERIKDLHIPIPPSSEQKLISRFLDFEIQLFESIKDKCNQSITLLQERRTALISAAVTGKIDVRDWQVPVTQTESDEVMA